MTPKTLTPLQYRRFTLLLDLFRKNGGICPSFVEIGQAWGLTSKGVVHRNVVDMEAAGLIRRMPGRSRALEINRFCTVVKDAQGDAQLVGCTG